MEPWVLSVLKEGYQIPFHSPPPLSPVPLDYPAYQGNREKFEALQTEVQAMLSKKAIEEVPALDPGFYNRLFLVKKASGAWRPVLDVSKLNEFVSKTKFSMETTQSVLDSIQKGDWMVSMDMKDAYFHIPIHEDSRPFLRFTFNNKVYQFRALCFGLSTAPQVFTRVLAPVSRIIHLAGFKVLLYLDDWLVIGSSKEEVLRAKSFILNLTNQLGILINMEKSVLDPSQVINYLGMTIDAANFWVFPAQKRIDNALSIFSEFLSSDNQSARSWQSLLGHMSSLEKFVPGGRLRMRRFQHHLQSSWDRRSQKTLISFPQSLTQDLSWWANRHRLSLGISLAKKSPDLQLFSDASREGWGAVVDKHHLSGKWSPQDLTNHINFLELKAIWLALQAVESLVRGKVIAVFSDNSTALAYIHKQGGTKSQQLCTLVRELFLWLEERQISLIPRFISGEKNVVADTLSRKGQILPTEWTLHPEVCLGIWRLWGRPQVDLFATSLTKRLPIYMSPHPDPQALATDALLQDWSNSNLYAFPPFAIVRKVLNKFRESHNSRMTLIAPWWPQREWFPDLLRLVVEEPRALPLRKDLLSQPMGRGLHQNLPMLHLTAWRLSTVFSDIKAAPRKFPVLSSMPEAIPPIPYTSGDGPPLSPGVGLGSYLPPVLL